MTRGRWTVLVAALAAGALACGSPSKPGSAPAPIQPATTATAGTTAAPPAAAGMIGEGTWSVPEQVKPGTYRATVPANSFGCYWARLKNLSGGMDAIIANNNVNPGGQATVTVAASDKGFETRGCGPWTKVG